MKNICEDCEYGKRYIDLGNCPECSTGRIIGDFHTRGIKCSTGHEITAVAVDFCGEKNCETLIIYEKYNIQINSELSYDEIKFISDLTEMTKVEIYKAMKNNALVISNVDFINTLKISDYFTKLKLVHSVIPELPYLEKFNECFENYENIETIYRLIVRT